MSKVKMLRTGGWSAIWRGQRATATFNSRGAALAYLATCNRAGKLRA